MPIDQESLDELMDQAHEELRGIDAEFARMRQSEFMSDRDVDQSTILAHKRDKIQASIGKILRSEHAPIGYQDHYNQKYMTQPQDPQPAAEPEGPGMFQKFLNGVGDTGKFVIQHPKNALAHAYLGAKEFASLPLRGVEGLLDRDIPGIHARQNIREHQEALAKADQAEGIDPRGTGPVVAETLGSMAVPLPGALAKLVRPKAAPQILSMETAKNFGKGAAFAGGVNVTERVANNEPVDDEGLTASMGIGGLINSAFGRFMGRRGNSAASTGSSGSVNGGIPPSTAPPNAGGARDVVDASYVRGVNAEPPPTMPPRPMRQLMGPPPGRTALTQGVPNEPKGPVQAPTAVAEPTAKPAAIDTLLRREQPKPAMPSMADAAQGIEQEKAARVAMGRTPENTPIQTLSPKQSQAIPPNQIIDVAKKVDDEVQAATHEALLRDVVSGKVDAKNVKVQRPKGKAPIAAVKGEVGAKPVVPADAPFPAPAGTPQMSERPPQASAAPLKSSRNSALPSKAPAAEEKPKLTNVRLEEFLDKEGYKLETKEPFPGEKSYNVVDPKTGNTIARGDREQLVNALNARNEGKGFKLYSGVDPTPLWEKVKDMVKGVPDDVTVTHDPARERPINMMLRGAGLETPQFAMRKTGAGQKVVNRTLDFEDLKQTRVNDLFHQMQKDGSYKDTKLFDYFGAGSKDKQAINKALVLEDKLGVEFTPEQLMRSGLNTEQVRMHQGVREALGTVKGWLSDMGADVGRLKGYIPRTWSGELELFVDGRKHVQANGSSSFGTLQEAAPTMWKLKQEHPGAKIEARFFTDPNYLMHRGIKDAQAVVNVRHKLEKMGSFSKDELDELFKVSKSYKDFSRHLLERGDATGYDVEDLDRVLYSYFNKAAKHVEGKKLREAVEKVISEEGHNLSEAQVKFLDDYVNRTLGKPTWDQMAVRKFVRQTPIGKWIDPIKSGAAIKTARDWITYNSLGFGNVSWALVNLDSLSRHVWPMLQRDAKGMGDAFASEKYMGAAIKEFFNNPNLKQKLAHNGVVDIQMMSEHRPALGAKLGKNQITPADVIMILGKSTEEFVRGVAGIARYRMALDQGLNDYEAMRQASRFVAETVGRYSKAGKPQAFTGGVGSTLGMFKTYPIVMLQNMFSAFESKDPGVIVRYMLASLAAGGVIGAIPGSEEIDKLATQATGVSPIQWGHETLGDGVMTGIASIAPGDFATDLSRKAGLPDIFPNTTKDWLGPVINTYAQAVTDVVNGEYKEAAKDLIPTSIKNALSVAEKPGYVVGRYDKPLVELKPGATARTMRGLGFQSPEETRSLRDYEYLNTLKDSHASELKKLTRRMYKGEATDDERRRFQELGGTNRRIRGEAQRETLTLRQRQERGLPRLLRHQRPETE